MIDGMSFLDHCLAALTPIVDEVVVSLAPGQEAPPVPKSVRLAIDERLEAGPLVGFAAGLSVLDCEQVAVVSCDAPLVKPKLIERLFERLAGHDAVAPIAGGRVQFFPGVYRRDLQDVARRLLDGGVHSVALLVRECDHEYLAETEVVACDPCLESFLSVNTPQEYAALLERRPA